MALSALWAFAPDPGDDDTAGSDVGFLAAGLVAVPTGEVITDGPFRGPDLLLTRPMPEPVPLQEDAE